MAKINENEIIKVLINFYKEYLKNKEDRKILSLAKAIYLDYEGMDLLLDNNLAYAVRILVDIGYKTGIPPKSDEEIKEIIDNLEKLNKKRVKDNPQK